MHELAIILISLAFAALARRSLPWALAALIIALPAYQVRFSVGPVPSTLLEVIIIAMFSVWVARAWQRNELPGQRNEKTQRHVRRYPFWREAIALLAVAFVSAGVAGFTTNAVGILKAYFIEPVMVFVVAVNVFKDERNRPLIVGALAASVLWVSLVAWYQFFTGDFIPAAWQGTGRVTGPFVYPNALGLYVGPVIPLLIGWLWMRRGLADTRRPWWRRISPHCYLAMAAVAAATGAIVLAKSDGAAVGVAAAFVVMGALYSRRTRRFTLAAVALAAVMLLFMPGQAPVQLYRKATLQDLDGQIRLMLWRETYEMLTAGPARFVFGAGLANFQLAVAPYHAGGIFFNRDHLPEFHRKVVFNAWYRAHYWQPVELYLYPHNLIVNFWSELGLAGVAVMGWLIVHFFTVTARAWRRSDIARRALYGGLMGAMVVIIVHGLVDVPYFKNDLAVMFWVVLALSGVWALEQRAV